MAKRIGILDVAAAAGVSVTTVSHALSGQGKISPATRERVERIAREMGYAPNRIASALRKKRSSIIGFVSDEIATTPFAGRIVLGAQDAAAERGALLMVVTSNLDPRVEQLQLDALLAQQVDAIMYAKMSHRVVTIPPHLSRVPAVLVDAIDPDSDLVSIVPDEEQIGRTATQYLIDAGHRRIVHVSVDEIGPGADGRIRGYDAAMTEAGLTPLVIRDPGRGDSASGRHAFELALQADPNLTAVFSFNDPMAMGVYQIANERGMRIPDRLSVVSVDNLEIIAAQLRPSLTTVALPHYEMGRMATNLVFDLIENPHDVDRARRVRLSCELIARESVAPPFEDARA